MSVLDSGHYSDIRELGGLGAALEILARETAIDIGAIGSDYASEEGRLLAPTVTSSRGVCRLSLGAQERQFFVQISQPGFTWATGSTDDLPALVAALGAWRAGMAVEEFGRTFAFIKVNPVAKYYESGDPATGQWKALLTDEAYTDERPLVQAVYSDGRFIDMLPGLTHGVLTLNNDVDRPNGPHVRLTPRPAGGFTVMETGTHAFREVATLTEALEVIAQFRDL
jgi:hypothetical protein